MRGTFLVGILFAMVLPAASTEALPARITTGFIAQPTPGRYWAMSAGYRAAFDADGIQFVRHGRRAALRFPGAQLRWEADGEPSAQVHFLGAETTSFQGTSRLRARDAYPGVDILIRLRDGQLKSEFQLAPGVSPSAVSYCWDGARVRVEKGGTALRMDAGEGWRWREEGLESWQETPDGRRVPVRTRFRVEDGCVRFQTGRVDRRLPLSIDPELVFSTYLGGGMFDAITAVATDASGNLYLGGWTEASDFPSLSGYQPSSGGRIDGFVAKVSPAGQLLFSTYLGGSNEDRVQGLAIDSAGGITVSGLTSSINFPVAAAARGALAGGKDAFVTRLTATGNQLVFSTYLGGLAHDTAFAVALDPGGNVVVGGETASTDFPVLSAMSTTSGGGVDGFVSRLSAVGALLSSTYFGGGGDDRVRGLAVDADGAIHATGSTASSNLPVAAAPYPALRGSMDAFYARFNSVANAVTLSTYLGGSGGTSLTEEAGYGVAIDSLGRIWIAGVTPSADFPAVSSGHQTTYGGGSADAFVALFAASGTHLWSTYLGGSGLDAATSIAAGAGFVGLAGYTTSNNLPVTGALQATRAGDYDAFWAAFPISSTAPLYVSYLGGSGADSGLAAAASGSAMAVAGSTLSSNFPLLSPIQSSNPGGYGGFVSRIRFGPGPVSISPASGTGLSGTFAITYAHANGSSSIVNTAVLFNATYTFNNGCYIYYDRGTNIVSLFKDAGSVWLTLTPGTPSTVDNGVCSIAGGGVTVTANANSLTLTLPLTFSNSFSGAKEIYGNANDSAGLGAAWPRIGSWSIVVPAAPAVGTASPSSGTGLSQTFAFTFSDANGAADIASASVFFNRTSTTLNACYFTYNRATNTISLFRDSDSSFLPITPGVNTTVENDNCSITGAGASVTSSGTVLTLTIPVTFKSVFSGPRGIYQSAADSGGLTAGAQSTGTWTPVAAFVPTVTSALPSSGGGPAQSFTVTFADGNGFTDIGSTAFLVNTSASTSGGCYITHNRLTNTLSLYRDADATFLTLVPGANTTIENTVCSINGAGTVVSGGGTQLALTLPITFKSTVFGTRNLYAAATDLGGLTTGWQTVGSWIPFVAYAPAVTGAVPSSGSGSIQTFTFTLTDANGSGDISTVGFLFNTSAVPANGCYLTYLRGSNTITLFRDSDGAQLPLPVGVPGAVENQNCSISSTGLTVTASGNQLVVTLPMTFKTAFSGTKNVYAAVTDAGGLSTGWQSTGSWSTGSSAAPTVTSVSPNAGSGLTQTFTVRLSDPNGFEDISGAVILINNVIDGGNSCYLFYNRAANLIYLYRDSDGTWPGIAPSASGSVANSNCSLAGNGFSATGAGTLITLVLPLTFQNSFAGTKNIYVSVNDQSNLTSGWVTAGTWTPFANPAIPAVTSLTPNSGAGASQTFTIQLSDANGSADISSAIILINGSLDGTNACYMSFGRAANTLHLFQDATNTWAPLAGGSNGTVANNNCAIAGTGLTATASGNTVTLSIPITFKPAFAGARNVYVLVYDAGGLSSGWVTAGTWTTGDNSAPPSVTSLSPNSGSGATQTFTLTLSDANGNLDITGVLIIVNNAINGYNSCFLSFNRPSNAIHLYRDSDNTWPSLAPGQSATISNDNCTLSGTAFTVTPSGNSLILTLPLTFKAAFSGLKSIFVSVLDSGNLSSGWTTAGTWTPPGAPAAPTVGAASPGSGSGTSQTFTFSFTDANGNADIAGALVVINAIIDGNNACYLSFSRSLNSVYLFRDSDGTWLPLTLGSAGTVTNSNCTISGAGLAIGGSGNTLTLSIPITFKTGFSGSKNIYASASDYGGLNSGWIIAGTWNPGGAPVAPAVSALTPASGAGSAQTFTITLSDSNGSADIADAFVIINRTINGNNGCFVSFNRAANVFYLFRDSDGVWQPLAPGSAGSVTNSNCTISGTGLSAPASGNALTLNLPVTFKTAFAGPKNIYISATDAGNLTSGWITAGSWTVN